MIIIHTNKQTSETRAFTIWRRNLTWPSLVSITDCYEVSSD